METLVMLVVLIVLGPIALRVVLGFFAGMYIGVMHSIIKAEKDRSNKPQ